MSHKNKGPKITPQPRQHVEDCSCPQCLRRKSAAPGGAREITVDNVHGGLPLLSADDRSRWSRLVDTAMERDGKRGFVSVRDDLCRWLGFEREAAWQVWSNLTDEERSIFALRAQDVTMREIGQRLGCSASKVCRVSQRVCEALAAAHG